MKKTIEKIVDYTVKIADPIQIILFGSVANGNYNANSDIDLLLICEDDQHKQYVVEKLNNFSNELSLKADILFVTPKQIEVEANKKSSFISAIFKNGKIIYKK